MKYATRLPVSCMSGLLLLALAGCDVAPEYRLTQTPVGAPSSSTLDPDSSANITAYFYAGAMTDTDTYPAVPVEGLHFYCKQSGYIKASGSTDENGEFVCPRTTTASFYIGDPTKGIMQLGAVDLSIFGSEGDTSARNRVTITPGSLYGTATDARRKEVANLFNLFASLDAMVSRTGRYQQTVVLPDTVQATLATMPELQTLSLTSSVAQFARDLRVMVNRLQAEPTVELRLATLRPAAPVLDSLEVEVLADSTLLRARSGLYRTAGPVTDVETLPDRKFSMISAFRVESSGQVGGYIESYELFEANPRICGLDSSSNPRHCIVLDVLRSNPGGSVAADGKLTSILFGSPSELVSFNGSFVNDYVFGAPRLCNASSENTLVPATYCRTPAAQGGYELADRGDFDTPYYTGDLYLSRVAETLPDIDLDLLQRDYLPRTFEMTLARYSDIGWSEFNDGDNADPDSDKDAFGPLEVLPGNLRYTLMPNGDIVSDIDGDCSDLRLAGGFYRDVSGDTREYVLGRIGNVFQVNLNEDDQPEDNRSYLTLHFSVLDEEMGTFFGLNIGFTALHRNLYPVTLAQKDGVLASKRCDPRSSAVCKDVLEWFNDINYFEDVYDKQVQLLADGVAQTDSRYNDIYKAALYYGQITGNTEVSVPVTTICRPAAPATP